MVWVGVVDDDVCGGGRVVLLLVAPVSGEEVGGETSQGRLLAPEPLAVPGDAAPQKLALTGLEILALTGLEIDA